MQTDSGKKPFKLRPDSFLKLAIFLLALALLAILAEKYLNFGGPEMPPAPSVRRTVSHTNGWFGAEWVPLAEDVQAFQLIDYRIALYDADDAFKFKEGNQHQEWRDLPDGDFQDVILNGEMPVVLR